MSSKKPQDSNGNTPFRCTSEVDNSIYLQVWKMMQPRVHEQKSNVAVMGSSANLLDVTELESLEAITPSQAKMSLKKRFSGVNCVLADDDLDLERLTKPFAPAQAPATTSKGTVPKIDSGFKVPHYDHSLNQLQSFRGKLAQYQSESKIRPVAETGLGFKTKEPTPPLSQSQSHTLEKRTGAHNGLNSGSAPVSWQPVAPTTGDFASNPDLPDGTVQGQKNDAVNRNNININLTFAMGQYQNGGKTETPPFYDVQELKPPRMRTTVKKPKTEISIQTDRDSLSDLSSMAIGYGTEFEADSTSTFPSVTPSRQSCPGQADRAVCVPRTNALALNEYIDIPAVVEYTGESVKKFMSAADHIINNYIIMPDDNYYTAEELTVGEGKLGIAVMRLLGVPQQIRHSIYHEALNNVQALQEFSCESVQVINNVIGWLCNDDGYSKEKLLRRLRRIASVSTDTDPESEAWAQFETEFGIYTEAVGEVVKQSYNLGQELVRRCSSTILSTVTASSKTALALMGPPESGRAASRKSSSVQVRPSLPAITEDTEATDAELLEAERDKFAKLKEAFKLLEAELELGAEEAIGQSLQVVENGFETSTRPTTRDWAKRDAFLEAPTPESQNSLSQVFHNVCHSLTTSLLNKTQTVLKSLNGTGETPVLGESLCPSRDEGETRDWLEKMSDSISTGSPEVEQLAAEIHKLAALTDSYFIEPAEDVPEPEQNCPPPPVPKRSWTRGSKTIMSIDLDREIPLSKYSPGEYNPALCTTEDYVVGSNANVPEPGIIEVRLDDSSVMAISTSPDAEPEMESLSVLDSNVNEDNQPKILDLVKTLRKYWPNKSISMVLTPEAQLQYAMNSYFDANGNKAEVQMSVAALKVLEKSKTGQLPKTLRDRPSSAEKAQSDTQRLERMIQDLRDEVHKHKRSKSLERPAPPVPGHRSPATVRLPEIGPDHWVGLTEHDFKSAKSSKSKEVSKPGPVTVPQPRQILPAVVPIENVIPQLVSSTVPIVASETDVTEATFVEPLTPVPTPLPSSPSLVPAEVTYSFVVARTDNPTNPSRPKFSQVSSRLTRIPARLNTAQPMTTGPPSKNTGTVASPKPKPKPFLFGKSGSTSVPVPKPKIKIINTVPFTQPKIVARGSRRPQSQPPVRGNHSGSYGRDFQNRALPPSTAIPQLDGSRANLLARTNSYRQLFQIRQLVSNGPVGHGGYGQSPNDSQAESYTTVQMSPQALAHAQDNIGAAMAADIMSVDTSPGSTLSNSNGSTPSKKIPYFPF